MFDQDEKNEILRKEVLRAFTRCIYRLNRDKFNSVERDASGRIWEKSRLQALLDVMWYGKIITLDQMWLLRNYIKRNYGYDL